MILVNTVFLAMDSPIESPNTPKQRFLNASENYFVAFFTLEMIVKVIAYGFVLHKRSYLRDAWNCIDFFIVVMGYRTIELQPPTSSPLNQHWHCRLLAQGLGDSVGNVSGIRVVRLLRPLRTLSAIEGNVDCRMVVLLGLFTDVLQVFVCSCKRFSPPFRSC